jgi:hypothetical protein
MVDLVLGVLVVKHVEVEPKREHVLTQLRPMVVQIVLAILGNIATLVHAHHIISFIQKIM